MLARPTFKENDVNLQTVKSVMALTMSLHLGMAHAASPVIGTVFAKGAFRLDSAMVNGNATLFEGSTIETSTVPSSVQLHTGARVSLGTSSRGRLFGDRMVLEKGTLNLENAAGFKLLALGLTIQAERGASSGRVFLDNGRRVRIAASGGSLRILNASGQLVANMAPGVAMAFEPQSDSNLTRVTGVIQKKGDHYVLTDEVTKVTIEIRGADLSKYSGKRVEVTGTMDQGATPVSDATQVVLAKEIRVGGNPWPQPPPREAQRPEPRPLVPRRELPSPPSQLSEA
jgi:uncharacterized protein YdeI (BOF family)